MVKLSRTINNQGIDYIKETNLSSYDFQAFNLSKSGYGSLKEIKELDTKEFLDLIEYEHLQNSIQQIIYDEANQE